MISGIDVSHFQGTIDWQAVQRTGIDFAYAKATQGPTWSDPLFQENIQGMKAAKIPYGAYHYFEAGQEGQAQAEHFLNVIDPSDSEMLPPTLDLEVSSVSAETLLPEVKTWLDLVGEQVGVQPIIYTNARFWDTHVSTSFGQDYALWIANYEVEEPAIPQAWNDWTIWQYSAKGLISGIQGDVDLDQCQTTLDVLRKSGFAEQSYTVQSGDTLSAIAQKFNVALQALIDANHINNPDLIQIGQVLTIPKS